MNLQKRNEATVPNVTLNITVESPFGNLYRKQHVLIVCVTPDNKVLLGRESNFYPEGIFRFIGGGVEKDDSSFISAARREAKEELDISRDETNFKPIFVIHTNAVDNKGVHYTLDTHIFLLHLQDLQSVHAGDDIDELVMLTFDEVKQLSHQYKALSKDDYKKDGDLTFSWYDYGQLYGPIHELVAEYLLREE